MYSTRVVPETITRGLEITSNKGIKVFLDNQEILTSTPIQASSFRGAAFHLSLVRLFFHGGHDCDTLEPQTIEIDHIRFYKPKEGD